MVSLIGTDSNSLLISAVLTQGLIENSADYIYLMFLGIFLFTLVEDKPLRFLWLCRYRACH